MGRSIESVRQGVKDMSDHWMRVSRALHAKDRPYGEELAVMAKRHSSEGFLAFDDPVEASAFSLFLEALKKQEARVE